ncbi:hypothetical protein LJ656_21510 [Paraburkholderia sp. MMS20-SJTR3]|uniref:2OG-Fe(II) oxygenase superfamily protein n=1 Tax=Paraburkholderia sejongensis TaxID=2886946 RepID=A0ABS8JZW5_9BURK|nr:hypothetical protein [Paraburkholderia sp. MMS20-SJTR3]MCC8395169.1 hypothetical protein [Paraburkholderia sp. MMS20-SJTR3]
MHVHKTLICWFHSGETLRSRSVSDIVLSGVVDIPAPPIRLRADWDREIASNIVLEPGDVDMLPLARARMRWPDYMRCVRAVADWTDALGIPHVLAASDVALMACRGARYHHDGDQYGGAAFCNLFLSEDNGLDVFFPASGVRVPLTRGTVILFDPCQPHGVVPRGASVFNEADFAADRNRIQVFLTWELSIEEARVAQSLRTVFDVAASNCVAPEDEQLWFNGGPVGVCPESGRWCRAQ